ncbi:hypothetical protein ACFOHS_21040 [Jhaorihella thermophila]
MLSFAAAVFLLIITPGPGGFCQPPAWARLMGSGQRCAMCSGCGRATTWWRWP